jgi:hypothetical protein
MQKLCSEQQAERVTLKRQLDILNINYDKLKAKFGKVLDGFSDYVKGAEEKEEIKNTE